MYLNFKLKFKLLNFLVVTTKVKNELITKILGFFKHLNSLFFKLKTNILKNNKFYVNNNISKCFGFANLFFLKKIKYLHKFDYLKFTSHFFKLNVFF